MVVCYFQVYNKVIQIYVYVIYMYVYICICIFQICFSFIVSDLCFLYIMILVSVQMSSNHFFLECIQIDFG